MRLKISLFPLIVSGFLLTGCDNPPQELGDSSKLHAAEQTSVETNPAETKTVVTVNGEAISTDAFGIYLSERVGQAGGKNTPELQQAAINEIINVILLSQEAAKQQLDQKPRVRLAIDLQRKQLLSRLAIQHYAQQNPPSEEALKKAYEERFGNQAGNEYKARHILVETEEAANKIISELDQGSDFSELAKQHSTGPTGKKGGDLGWFGAGQMVKPFSDAAQALDKGAYTKEPVQTQFGWHVILLEDTREAQPPAFDAVKQQLTVQLQRQAMSQYMAELRDGSEVEFNEEFIRRKSDTEATPETAADPKATAKPEADAEPKTE